CLHRRVRRPPRPTLLPYTTLFRSLASDPRQGLAFENPAHHVPHYLRRVGIDLQRDPTAGYRDRAVAECHDAPREPSQALQLGVARPAPLLDRRILALSRGVVDVRDLPAALRT